MTCVLYCHDKKQLQSDSAERNHDHTLHVLKLACAQQAHG